MWGFVVWRLCSLVLIAAVVVLCVPASAFGHLQTGTLSTDFEARIGGFRPAAAGVSARVLEGDQKLEVSVRPPHVVIVWGLLGEPFLRFSSRGVEANVASPTASSTKVVPASEAVSSGHVVWRRVSGGHVFAWHENRLRPSPVISGTSTTPRRVASWSIAMLVDGRHTVLAGTEWYATRPPLWPWIASGLALVAAAGLMARFASMRLRRTIAIVVLPLVVASLLAGWSGIFLADRASPLGLLFAIAYTCVGTAFVLVAVTSTSGAAQVAVIALVGLAAATFALPQLLVFAHGFVLSALPATDARAAAAFAVVGGIVIAILGIPATIQVFNTPPAIDTQGYELHQAVVD